MIEDKWLSNQLGIKSFFFKKNFNTNFKKIKNLKNKFFFVTCKVGTKSKYNKLLIKNNFSLIEQNIIFKKKIIKKQKECNFIRLAKREDRNQVLKITSKAFVNSRFFKDVNILKKRAIKLKKNWVNNYFLGKRGDEMYVSFQKNEITGFILLIKKPKLIVDLIAIKKKFRKRNIGSNLINYCCNKNYNLNYLYAGTQKSNIDSIKFYKKNNFKIDKKINIYHGFFRSKK